MRWSVCALLLSAINASAQQPVRPSLTPVSPEKQAAFGASLARDFSRSTVPLDSPAALAYVQRLGAKLAEGLPQPHANFTFSLIKSDSCGSLHEPCSFPGGYIFVSASLFLAAQNEAEFASMLAHAMAYVQTSSMAPIVMAGWTGFGTPADSRSSFMALELQSKRADDRAADALAVKLSSAAGYDPQALADYLARIWRDQDNAPQAVTQRQAAFRKYLATFYDSHDTRLANIQTAIHSLPATAGDDFLGIQKQIRDLTAQ